jgi:short-chain Z-isoprenyl diphosphate synthase
MPFRDLPLRVRVLWARRRLAGKVLPEHVGIIMDGNRRWARKVGLPNPSLGHRHGAERVADALGWCAAAGIRHVTVFVCSTENLRHRSDDEIAHLMKVIEDVAATASPSPTTAGGSMWPDAWFCFRSAPLAPSSGPSSPHAGSARVGTSLAVGYGGRQEIADAAGSLLTSHGMSGGRLQELAETLDPYDLAAHLYTAGQPDIDLVIRTSGERRLSNWLLWQSTHAELVFSDAYWPAFREIDFLRALAAFTERRSARARQTRGGSA